MPTQRPALLVQLQPITPWRCTAGHAAEPASLLASDSLFGAISHAMGLLGWLPEWLAEGARSVRLSSAFPNQGELYYAPLPESLRSSLELRRLRIEAVRFAPLSAIRDMASKKFDENRWVLDLASGCLLLGDRAGTGGPFRAVDRRRAAVDRFSGAAIPSVTAEGIEFGQQGGVWSLAVFAGETERASWSVRLQAAFRLLADEGVGGWRGAGWGRSRKPRFREGQLAKLSNYIGWPVAGVSDPVESSTRLWWTLGLFAPAESDAVDWTSGAYRTLMRTGWTANSGPKSPLRLVREGAILQSPTEPSGRIVPVETAGADYPVYRYGAGLALPWQVEG